MPEAHELKLRVRYAETDQMGVVHHASYLVYLEEGRTALMRSLGFPYEEVERRGFAMVVRKMELRYRGAARYADELVVRTTVDRFRAASIRYVYEILRARDAECLLSGTVEVACLDRREGAFKPAALPPDIEDALERYLAD